MNRQRTDWGEIQWLEDERQAAAKGSQRVGIVTLPAGSHQPRHIHYGEQTIYVLEGEAESTVDGVTTRIVPGDLFHWKAGIVHEVRNPLGVPFRHLLVSSPVLE
ncbi:MAG: cupin domain-containing protein, partial [Clostridia bacterium]|nr:cupin domain-containing protein [Clostridia bacterium]